MSKILNFNEIVTSDKSLYLPNSCRFSQKLELEHKDLSLRSEHFSSGNGMSLNIMKLRFNDDSMLLSCPVEQKHSYLSFCLGDKIILKNAFEKFTFEENVCYHGSFIGQKTQESLYEKDKIYLNVSITLEDSIYGSLFKQEKSKLVSKNDDFHTYFNNQINPKQRKILNELLYSPFDDNMLNHIFLESKTLELLYESANAHQKSESVYLSEKDILCLQKAKDILLSDLANPPSLGELAKLCALNRNKLNQGFKQLFGETTYKFLATKRLEAAKKHLQSGDINIAQAAELVGYKHQRHFSKSFYEYFGEEAKEVKKRFWV